MNKTQIGASATLICSIFALYQLLLAFNWHIVLLPDGRSIGHSTATADRSTMPPVKISNGGGSPRPRNLASTSTPALSQIELGIISEMNRARANPPAYGRTLLAWRSRFNGNKVRLSDRLFLQTQEGTRAVDEAIAFLQKTSPVGTLRHANGLTLAARDHVRDQGMRGTTGHDGSDRSDPFQRMERYGKWQQSAGENIAYGPDTAQAVVRDLIIDDGVADRGHRTNIFQPKFHLTGVACGYHKQYRVMCAIEYAGGYRERF